MLLSRRLCIAVLFSSLFGAYAQAQPVASGAGATFPSAVYQAWIAKYEASTGKKIVYTPTGSGDGIKKISARQVVFAGSDIALSEAELAKNQLVQLPTLVGGMVPVVNLKGMTANELKLNGELLADIFLGRITQWNDKRIQAANPGKALPALPITRVVRADRSGSTEVFTRYLALMSPTFKAELGESSLPKWPQPGNTLVAAEGNDGIAKAMAANPGAIGYLSYDRVVKLGVASVKLLGGDGSTYVAASEEGFRAAVVASDLYKKNQETASLLNMPGASAWPITMTTYVLFDAQPKTAAAVNEGMQFLYWTQQSGDGLLRNSGFSPLPLAVQARFAIRFARIKPQDGQMVRLF
jgi:phosphate transport system substrate-binding protein